MDDAAEWWKRGQRLEHEPDWLRCRASVGEVRGGTFGKLLVMLVGLVLLHGVEVSEGWRISRTVHY